MKVTRLLPTAPSALRRLTLVLALAMALILGSVPASALAISRPTVLKRANHWIARRVRYSQRAYYGGYRRDCSGFVSMAWKLKKSYTSSSIRSKAHRISRSSLKPGDAVRRPGHVEIFAGWKSRSKRAYWALEESTWGKPARRRVKRFGSGCTALRYHGIVDHAARKPVKPSVPPVITPPTPPGSETTGTLPPSADSTSSLAPGASRVGALLP